MYPPSQPGPAAPKSSSLTCLVVALVAMAGLGLLMLLLVGAALLIWFSMPFGGETTFQQTPMVTEPVESHRAVGQRLPDLQLVPLTGASQPVGLEDLRGKVVLVNIWGPWCPPCREELPDIAAVERKFRARGDFLLLAVSCGRGGSDDVEELRKSTEALFSKSGIAMPTYADPERITREAFDAVGGFEGYPTTFLMDRQGVIREVWVGYDEGIESQLEELIPKLLSEKAE